MAEGEAAQRRRERLCLKKNGACGFSCEPMRARASTAEFVLGVSHLERPGELVLEVFRRDAAAEVWRGACRLSVALVGVHAARVRDLTLVESLVVKGEFSGPGEPEILGAHVEWLDAGS